jgi:hypothetical protein
VEEYRAYVIGSNGHFEGSRTFVCDTDENAIVWAKQMMREQSVELWCGARLVKRLPSSDNRQAVTHEVHEGRLIPKGKKSKAAQKRQKHRAPFTCVYRKFDSA